MFDSKEDLKLMLSKFEENNDSEEESSESDSDNADGTVDKPTNSDSDCESAIEQSQQTEDDDEDEAEISTTVGEEESVLECQYLEEPIVETTTGSDEEGVSETLYRVPLNMDALNALNASSTTSFEAVTAATATATKPKAVAMKNENMKNPSTKNKTNLYGKKKKRNPLGSPPPVPGVTPSNSARSEERLQHMMCELERVYRFPNKNSTNDEVVSPTRMSMSTINNPKPATSQQMTSDAKLRMTLKNVQVPLTEAFFESMADADTKPMSNLVKKTNKSKRNETDKSPKIAIEALQNLIKEAATNCHNPKYPLDLKNSKHDSPYEMKAWAKAMQDLPKVHEDKMLQTIMQKERALYEAFKDNEDTPIVSMNSPKDVQKSKPKDDPNNIKNLMQERDKFLEDCRTSRFYANPAYEQPWKIFSNIADVITQEVVGAVEHDFTQGVTKFVHDFLQLETQL